MNYDLGITLCHLVAPSKENTICLVASFGPEEAKFFDKYFEAYFYNVFGELIQNAQAAFTGISALGWRLGSKVDSYLAYRGHRKPFQNADDPVRDWPDLLEEISGSKLLKVKGKPLSQLHWVSDHAIGSGHFTFGECVFKFASDDLSWSTNLMSLTSQFQSYSIKDGRPYVAHDYYGVKNRTIQKNMIVPFYEKETMKTGFLYIREGLGNQEFLCEYYSAAGLILKVSDILISKSKRYPQNSNDFSAKIGVIMESF